MIPNSPGRAKSAKNSPRWRILELLNRGLGWFKWLFDNLTAMAHDGDKPDGGADKPTGHTT